MYFSNYLFSSINVYEPDPFVCRFIDLLVFRLWSSKCMLWVVGGFCCPRLPQRTLGLRTFTLTARTSEMPTGKNTSWNMLNFKPSWPSWLSRRMEIVWSNGKPLEYLSWKQRCEMNISCRFPLPFAEWLQALQPLLQCNLFKIALGWQIPLRSRLLWHSSTLSLLHKLLAGNGGYLELQYHCGPKAMGHWKYYRIFTLRSRWASWAMESQWHLPFPHEGTCEWNQ